MVGGGAGARQGILSLAIKDKAQLYGAYMPFVRGGGIFVPTNRRYSLGDEVEVRVAVHRGLDGPADRALEAEDELEPEGQVGRHRCSLAQKLI